jgi:hypothetical protein
VEHDGRLTPRIEFTLATTTNACVLHADIAKWLGIELDDAAAVEIGTMLNGVNQRGWSSRATLEFPEGRLELEVVFCENLATAGLLGWGGLMQHAEVEIHREFAKNERAAS